MPTAHLIHGYLGAGKTTLAKRLERDADAVRFTLDEWLTALHGEDEADIEPDVGTISTRLVAVMEPVWARCLTLGLDVVLDLGFWSRDLRDATRDRVEACGATAKVYDVRCADDVAWQRVEKRNSAPAGSLRMARNTFDVLRAKVDPLGPDEPHLTVDTTRFDTTRFDTTGH